MTNPKFKFLQLKNQKLWQNSKTKMGQNSNCDKTQKLILWQNSKIQIVTKLKNISCYKTKKLKLWPNSKTQIVTKFGSDSCDRSDSSDQNDSCDRSDSSDISDKKFCNFFFFFSLSCDKTQTQIVTT